MNRRFLTALTASVVLHGALLYAVSRQTPWVGPVEEGGGLEWTQPVFLSAYHRGPAPRNRIIETSSISETQTEPDQEYPNHESPTPTESTPKDLSGLEPSPTKNQPWESKPESSASRPDTSGPGAPEVNASGPGRPADHSPRLLVGALTTDREGSQEVEVRILVGTDGRVADVQPLDPTVEPELLLIIRKAAGVMRFVPARKNGKQVAAWVRMSFVL